MRLITLFYCACILLCSIGTSTVYAQYSNGSNGLSRFDRKVISPSPEATQLGSYGNLTPDLNTGSVQMSIPLVEVSGRQLKLPISLDYHYNGLLLDEIASWAGLGWTLNAGGVITRTVRGGADEKGTLGYLNSGWQSMPLLSTYQPGPIIFHNVSPPLTALQLECRTMMTHPYDLEPDAYTLTLPGYSGSFFIDPATGAKYLTPRSDYAVGGDFTTGWSARSGDGTQYFFDAGESVTAMDEGPSDAVGTAWYLTAICSADLSDTIRLEYDTIPVYKPLGVNTIAKRKLNSAIPYSNCDTRNGTGYDEAPGIQEGSYPVAPAATATVYLKRIITPTMVVVFHSTASRDDLLPGVDPLTGTKRQTGRRLYRITVTDRLTGVLRQDFNLTHGYFSNASTDFKTKRLRLAEVQEVGKPSHRFSYSGETTTFASRESFSKDHWGYYNAEPNANLVPSLPASQKRLYQGASNLTAIRQSNGQAAKLGILEQVTYPTGGRTRFEYEPNTVPVLCGTNGQFGETTNVAGCDVYSPASAVGTATISPYGVITTGGPTAMDSIEWAISTYEGSTIGDSGDGVLNVDAKPINFPYGGIICETNAFHSLGCTTTNGCSGGTGKVFSGLYRLTYTSGEMRVAERYCINSPSCVGNQNHCQSNEQYSCDNTLAGMALPPGIYYYAAGVSSSNTNTFFANINIKAYPAPNPTPPATDSSSIPSTPCYTTRQVGGVRVARITDYTATGSVLTKTYRYELPAEGTTPARSSGYLFREPVYSYTDVCHHLIVSAADVGKGNWLESGFHMGYDRVVVEQVDGSSTTQWFDNGRMVGRQAPSRLRNLVTRVEERTTTGKLVKLTTNEYRPGKLPYQVVGRRLSLTHQHHLPVQGSTTLSEEGFWLDGLSSDAYWPQLVRTAERTMSTNDTTSRLTTTTYRYLPLGPFNSTQPAQTLTQDAPGQIRLTRVKFAGQYYQSPTGLSGPALGVVRVAGAGMISVPVEHQTWLRRVGADSMLVGGDVTHFQDLRPHRIFALAPAAPIPAAQVTE